MSGKFLLTQSGDQISVHLKAGGNSEIILTGERYTRKATALGGIESIRENASIASGYQCRTSVAGEPYFVLKGQEW